MPNVMLGRGQFLVEVVLGGHRSGLLRYAEGGAATDAYACEACGLVEWYTVEPLQVDDEHVKRLDVELAQSSPEPYR